MARSSSSAKTRGTSRSRGDRRLMARIAGINIQLNKRVEIGLTYIYGVGRSQAQAELKKTGVDANTYVKDLTDDEIVKQREAIDNLTDEGDLRRERSQEDKRRKE